MNERERRQQRREFLRDISGGLLGSVAVMLLLGLCLHVVWHWL